MGIIHYALVSSLLIAAIYFVVQALRPKPLPGIPYNQNAANSVLGDVPEMMGHVMRTKRIFCWLTSLTTRHQSPIVQVFIKPMALPWVVLTDPFESQDILLRRTKEFDRSGFFGEVISGILPEQHIQFLSSDSRFKNSRNLINHLMAPTFVSQVSAPEVYKSACTLIKVWQAKCDLAQGRPFSAHHDITYAALDAIFASSFGLPEPESITIQRLDAVVRWLPEIPLDSDEPVPFPDGSIPEVFSAMITLMNSLTQTQLSPAPRLTSRVLGKLPYMRKAAAVKDKYIRDKVAESAQLIEGGGGGGGDTEPRSALHSVLLREKSAAAREGRAPDYHRRAIADEFFGFVAAGHDTAATTLAWGVKLLADHQAPQDSLRTALRAALPRAARERRAPTYRELSGAHVPYLDAAVEEVLRHANTIAFVARRALRDTTVLGRRIPRGTDVFMMADGAGYLAPFEGNDDDDEMRSPGARRRRGGNQANKALTGAWDNGDIAGFRPERWLKKTADRGDMGGGGAGAGTATAFDPMAGPTLAFGLGPRGCFGKRLALQALRIQFALIVWNFRLLEVPDALGGYEAVQKFAREPTKCYVRLENADI